jgi:molybdenum cofactor cytidylyltransferase
MDNKKGKGRNYACIILAAGQSKRMAQSKIVLPWGDKTVIGTILSAYKAAGITKIVVVTGGYRDLVEAEVHKYKVEIVFNPDFSNGEMSRSLQTGLDCISKEFSGIFVALGDQPDIYPEDIIGIMRTSDANPNKLIIPSYAYRRGHPWLIPAMYIDEISKIKFPETMKSFIQRHENEIEYYLVKKSNILADLDTPEDYQRLKPKDQQA